MKLGLSAVSPSAERSFMMAALMLRSNSTTVSFGQSLLRISSRETTPPSRRRSICKIWNCCSGRRTFRPILCKSPAARSSSKGPKRTKLGKPASGMEVSQDQTARTILLDGDLSITYIITQKSLLDDIQTIATAGGLRQRDGCRPLIHHRGRGFWTNEVIPEPEVNFKEEKIMKTKIPGCISAIALSAALAISVQLPAQGQQDDHSFGQKRKLIEFDPPGTGTVSSPACAPSCGTQAFANNAEGTIVGSYTDANVVPHGFLRTPDGHIISFDAPGAGLGANLNQGTVAYSINDLGVIAGQFQDASYVFHGFVRYPNGYFTTFDAPGAGTGASQGTIAEGINPAGTVAGWYVDENNVVHG